MPKDFSRPVFPTSSTDFALPSSTSSALLASSLASFDDPGLSPMRMRRPSILTSKTGYFGDTRMPSPLTSSFPVFPSKLKENQIAPLEDAFVFKPTSPGGNVTPPLFATDIDEDEGRSRSTRPKHLHTPPRRSSVDGQDSLMRLKRRLSFPIKQPRILNLLAESRPVENEVQSEAAFQRLIASGADLPMQPRTPRAPSDRGRFPEEAYSDDIQAGDSSPSDDEPDEDNLFAFYASSSTEPIAITKPNTPAGSVNGEDGMISASPSMSSMMDVDMPSGSPSMNSWRYTPPPTSSAVRSNKRKLDDRYDPYSNATKRRAVSPSLNFLRESHSNMGSPINRSNPRLPIAIPITIPSSAVSSACSSPTVASNSYSRSSMTASPTLRASMALASPILRPHRAIRRLDGEERELDGAGEAVGSLSLG